MAGFKFKFYFPKKFGFSLSLPKIIFSVCFLSIFIYGISKNYQRIFKTIKDLISSPKQESSVFYAENTPLIIAEKEAEKKIMQQKYLTDANIFYNARDYENALDSYYKVLEISSPSEDTSVSVFLKIAEINLILKNYSDSIKYYKYFIDYFSELHPEAAKIFNNLAYSFYSLNKYEKSYDFLLKSFQKDPSLIETYIGIGTYFLTDYNFIRQNGLDYSYDTAIHIYKKGLQKYPDNIKLMYNIAYAAYNYKKDYNLASEFFNRLILSGEKSIKPEDSLIVCKAAQYNYLIAKENFFESSDKQYLNSAEQYLNIINSKFEFISDISADNYKIFYLTELAEISFLKNAGIQTIEKIYAQLFNNLEQPELNNAILSIAEKFYTRALEQENAYTQYLKQSLNYFNRALKNNATSVAAYYGIGRVSYLLNQNDNALFAFNRVVNIITENLSQHDDKTRYNEILKNTYNYLGSLLALNYGRYKESITAYENALKLSSESEKDFYVSILFNLGAIYDSKLKNYNQAIDYFKQCLKFSLNYKYYKSIANCYFKLEDYNNAKDYLKSVLKSNHRDYEALYMLGYSVYREGEYNSAIQHFRELINALKGIKLNESQIVILNAAYKTLGTIYYFKYQRTPDPEFVQNAIVYYNNAINLVNLDHLSYYNCGLCYFVKKNYNKAITYFETAIKFNNNESRYYSALANCYFEKKIFEKAQVFYKKAIELNPGNEEAFYNLTLMKNKF